VGQLLHGEFQVNKLRFATLALVLLSVPAAFATSFTFSYAGGTVTATGTLIGSLTSGGNCSQLGGSCYNITSGNITVTGAPINGSGTLVANGNVPGFSTSPQGGFWYDNLFAPNAKSGLQMDWYGLLFVIGQGTNQSVEVNLWDNSNSYQLTEGYAAGNYPYNGSADLSGTSFTSSDPPPSVPEPASLALIGSGLLGLMGAIRRKWMS